ncbi:MAG: hypothetical protein HQM13_11155 [SAR324 cluster bacterium]|nr:hypothetical protein [SAR324 cluster bacterium]
MVCLNPLLPVKMRWLIKILFRTGKVVKGIILLSILTALLMPPRHGAAQTRPPAVSKLKKYILPPTVQKVRSNPNYRFRYPVRNLDRHLKEVRAHKSRQFELKKQRRKQADSQAYQRFQQRRDDANKYRQGYLKKQIEEKNKAPVVEEKAAESPQLLAKRERKALNVEILEGRKDPTVKGDPNYLKFIEEKTRLTKRN